MGIVRFSLNFLLAMTLWTVIGQVSIKDQTMEQRYSAWVNSRPMQQIFDTAFAPFRWSQQKMASLWEDLSPSKSQAR